MIESMSSAPLERAAWLSDYLLRQYSLSLKSATIRQLQLRFGFLVQLWLDAKEISTSFCALSAQFSRRPRTKNKPAKRISREGAMSRKLSRRQFVATTAISSAMIITAPYVRGAYAAGKLKIGFWDHWVPGA